MTTEKVILLAESVDDLEIGRNFYDAQEEGVGAYFVASLLSDISSLKLHAGIHSLEFDFHRMLSKRFPFAVYYEIVSGVARVVAVLDMRQSPKSIRRALEERKSQQEIEPNV